MPDCGTWWFDHVGETYMYVVAARQSDARMQQNAVDRLLAGTVDWGRLIKIPDAAELMEQHVSLVKQLADAAFAKDQGTVDGVIEQLLENGNLQTQLYSRKIPGFPEEEWEKLFTTHLTSTGGYVLALASGDMADFRKKYAETLNNRNALARLWGRLCLILKR